MATAAETQLLYITYFGRPADPAGLDYWTTEPQASLPLDQVADFFAADIEFAQTTAGRTVDQIVNSFYVNAFGRQADAPGLRYWVDKVNNNEISLGDVGYFIALAATVQPPGSPDKVALEAKLVAAQQWTDLVAVNVTATLEYGGPLAATYGVDFLAQVVNPATIPSLPATQAAIDGLPPEGTVALLKSSAAAVAEGDAVVFTITTIPSLAGKSLTYQLSGVQAADVVGGALTGTVDVTETGVATVQVTLVKDSLVEVGEQLSISFPNNIVVAKPLGGETVLITDVTVPTLQVQSSLTAVNEGGVLIFTITSTNLAQGTQVAYSLEGTGLTSADVNNAPLSGFVTLNGSGQAQVGFTISQDLSTEGPETVVLTAQAGGATATAQAVINDTSTSLLPALAVAATPSAVDEGSQLTFNISAINIAPNTTLTYVVTGIAAADVNGAALAGTRTVKADGTVDPVVFQVSKDLATEGLETATLTVIGGGTSASGSANINDTSVALVPSLSTSALPSAVNEGGQLTFTINAINIAPNTLIVYEVTGISSADVSGASLVGLRTVKADGTVDPVVFQVTNDLSTEGLETATFAVIAPAAGGVTASTTARISDTSTAAVRYLLTEQQDFVSGTDVPVFTFVGNEQTLGQGDELFRGDADLAVLEVSVAGEFNLNNFSTSGIRDLLLKAGGVRANGPSSVAMSQTDIRNIAIDRAVQQRVLFDDIQVSDLFVIIKDSVGDYEFNFDASKLNTGTQTATVWLDEIPVDQDPDNSGVGLYFSQGLQNVAARLEGLNLRSLNTSGDPTTNELNLIRKISVGDSLSTIVIDGDTNLEIVNDLGLPGSYANPFITLIDAEGLNADLTLSYTTQVQDGLVANQTADVTVRGAQGDNNLTFASTGPLPADFGVTTYAGDDRIITTTGDDTINAGAGNNLVEAGSGNNAVTAANGNNVVITGEGNDSVSLGDGTNTVTVGDGANTVTVGNGNNTIVSGSGNDAITAGTGNNLIIAGNGNNTVNAGLAGAGNNKVITGLGNDSINTGGGADVISSGDGNDNVNSGGGNDLVVTANGNDSVDAGAGNDNVAIGTGDHIVLLGTGSDTLWVRTFDLTDGDVINGGEGVDDTILLSAGGSLDESDLSGVSNVERFVLRNLKADFDADNLDLNPLTDHEEVQAELARTLFGPQADFNIILSNALVQRSNDLSFGVRRFTVDATNALADVTLSTTLLAEFDSAFNAIGITYLGSNNGFTERLIVSEASLSSRLIANFDDTDPGETELTDDEPGDILQLLGGFSGDLSFSASANDLININDVDVIELNSIAGTGQAFFITLTEDFLTRNASNTDPLIIRATAGLPAGSTLNLDVNAVTSAGSSRKIVVEKTGNLTVNVTGDPFLGNDAQAKVQVISAFFTTTGTDNIKGTDNSDLFLSGSISTLQNADNVDGGAGFDTMLFEFGVFDAELDFDELPTTAQVVLPSPPFSFAGFPPFTIGENLPLPIFGNGFLYNGGTFEGLPILTEFVTAVDNLLTGPVEIDPREFEGIFRNGEFLSSSQPDYYDPEHLPEGVQSGVAIGGLPFPSFALPRGFTTDSGSTLESQLNFVDIENVERYVFNPPNDGAVRFVGFNSLETFETPGFFTNNADAQKSQLDLKSLEILQTFDTSRSPNAGSGSFLIDGNGAPLNDILFLDDFSWSTTFTTKAEAFWSSQAAETYDVHVIAFDNKNGRNLAGFQVDYDFDRYVELYADPGIANDFEYGSFFDDDTDSERPQQRRSFESHNVDFALEVNTGAGNDYVWRGVFTESADGKDVGTIVEDGLKFNGTQFVPDLHYLAGYLVDTGSGDDVVTLDDVFFAYGEDGVLDWGLFGGNILDASDNPFYEADGDIRRGGGGAGIPPFAFADDVVLTRSGNDFVVDYGGDNIVYSGIGNDFVLTGYGNDFIVSDDDDELDDTSNESEIGTEAISGPAAINGTDNDIVLADGQLLDSFFQFNPAGFGGNPFGDTPMMGEDVGSDVFGRDYVRDLSGDNIISTGGNDDTVVTGLGDDIILAGTIGFLSGADGSALYNDSDVVKDLGGHNLIVTLGDDDYIQDGDGSSVILAGFGNDNDVVFAGGGADLIEFAGGSDYIDAGAGNDFMVSLLGTGGEDEGREVLSLVTGDWNGLTTEDTILGGEGFDTLALFYGDDGEVDNDVVIAPRLVLSTNTAGVPTTVSAVPDPGSYPESYDDADDELGSVNPIMDSVETLILTSDGADIYLTDTVARQAKNAEARDSDGNLVDIAKPFGFSQVTVFLNGLDIDEDIRLDASAFEANSSLRAFAYNIGAENLQEGIDGESGLIGGSGIDFLAAGFFLESGILAGGTDIATLLNEIRSFLDNQALDNFVGFDVSKGLDSLIGFLGYERWHDEIIDLFPNYPEPTNSVEDIQVVLDLFSGLLEGDFVEDYITYQGNGGGDFITLEPTVLDIDGTPRIRENTVEFVRYETVRDGAFAGQAVGFDQVFNFNNTGTNLPYSTGEDSFVGEDGALTNDYRFVGEDTDVYTRVEESGFYGGITGDKIVLGGGVGQVGDIVSKNGNQLVDLFKVNAAVNWSTGRRTVADDGALDGDFISGDEALFVDYAIQLDNDQIVNFDQILRQINSFGTIVSELNQGGLVVVNGGDKAIFGIYQELDGNFANIASGELSILGLVQGISTNSFRLQASDFIIDNDFVTYERGIQLDSTYLYTYEDVDVNLSNDDQYSTETRLIISKTPSLPVSGQVWDSQPAVPGEFARTSFTNGVDAPTLIGRADGGFFTSVPYPLVPAPYNYIGETSDQQIVELF